MSGRKMVQITAAALLLTTATVSPVLLQEARSAADAEPSDTVRAVEPDPPGVDTPPAPTEKLVPPDLTPRWWRAPTFRPEPMRGLLAAGVLIPPAPRPIEEPPPPLVASVPVDEDPFVLPAMQPMKPDTPTLVRAPACCELPPHPRAPHVVGSC